MNDDCSVPEALPSDGFPLHSLKLAPHFAKVYGGEHARVEIHLHKVVVASFRRPDPDVSQRQRHVVSHAT